MQTTETPSPSGLVARTRARLRGVFYGWWIVTVAFAGYFTVGGFYSTGLSLYFLPVTRDLNLSRAVLSFAFTLRTLEGGLWGPFIGYLVDRLGPRFIIRAGALVMALGFALFAVSQDYLSFLLAFLGAMAIGANANSQASMAIINQWFARHRSLAITMGFVGTEAGGTIITPLIALVILNYGWRAAALLSAVLIPLMMIPGSIFLRNTPESMGLNRDGDPDPTLGQPAGSGSHAAPQDEDFEVREAVRTMAFWRLATATGMRMFAKSGLTVHLVPLLVWKGIDEPTAALLVGLSALTQVPARILGAWAGDRWSLTAVPAIAGLAGVAGVVVLLFGPSDTVWVGVGFVLLYAMGEAGNLVGWSLIGEYYGRAHFGTLRGLSSLIQSPLSLPSATWLGWIFDVTGSYYIALIPSALAYGIGSLLYVGIRRPRRPARSVPVGGVAPTA